MASQNAQRAHKVEVIDEVKTRMGGVDRLHRERIPGPDRRRDGRTPQRPVGRGRRLQDLQEHARAPGDRRRRVPATVGVPQRSERPDLRAGRHQRRGQGPAGLLPDQPPPGDQGWSGRRVAPFVDRPGRLGRPARGRCCWPGWPVPSLPRCNRWRGSSRRCRATWRTGSPHSSSSVRRQGRRCQPLRRWPLLPRRPTRPRPPSPQPRPPSPQSRPRPRSRPPWRSPQRPPGGRMPLRRRRPHLKAPPSSTRPISRPNQRQT